MPQIRHQCKHMITEAVIKDIYKHYGKPLKNRDSLDIAHFQELLAAHNPIKLEDEMITIENLEEFSPFKRFFIRSLNGVIEIDNMVALVFQNHIIFLNKEKADMRVHLRPQKSKGFFSRLFSR